MRAQPDLAAMRQGYARAALDEGSVAADPLEQFSRWLQDAIDAGLPEPNAMVVATATSDGVPSARTVLLKGVDDRGFTFFTNTGSRKAAELAANPVAALVFPWHAMHRQVRVAGRISVVDQVEVADYFATRPRDSQLGAWASPQSQVIAGRAELDARLADVAARWPDGDEVPTPEFWGGYRLVPAELEFWAGREGRLHDRLRYLRADDGEIPTGWRIDRLAP
jgi:pyridoxamine 5'-phosphate oxidase